MNFRYWARRGTISNRPPDEGAENVRRRQGGQTLVLFAIFFTVILGTAALVLDQGLLRKANFDLYNALDAGALAGVSLLKDDPVGAEKLAREYVQLNYPGGLPDSDVQVDFRCIIGVEDGAARTKDVPFTCDPGAGASWTIDGSHAYASCDPDRDHVCNTIVVSSPATVDYNFAPVLGVLEGSTGARTAAACKGPCGEPPQIPVDLVVIIDRTTSMDGVDTANARNAADSLRKSLDPDLQWLSLGTLGPSRLGAYCRTEADSVIGGASVGDLRRWVPIGLTGTGASFGSSYTSDSSDMARAIACFNNSRTSTDIADPVTLATYELMNYAREDSIKAILLLSDGQPNRSTTGSSNYCLESDKAATAAKNKGIQVYTVGFGLDGSNDAACGDRDAPWRGLMATDLLASMATDSVKDGGCPGTENSDGDNYFCLPKTAGASTDLADVFQVAVEQLSGYSRLVNVD